MRDWWGGLLARLLSRGIERSLERDNMLRRWVFWSLVRGKEEGDADNTCRVQESLWGSSGSLSWRDASATW